VGDLINKERNKQVPGIHGNENTSYQNLWNTAKAVLRQKFIAISDYTQKRDLSNKQSNDAP
jgi:hypothetical protein